MTAANAAAARHLVAVWNPAYALDAMDATVQLLLGQTRRHRAGECDEEEVSVWWGKVRSPNRQQPMPHLAEVLALNETLAGEDGALQVEMHLYLTDYRSLYVGHVASITSDDVRADAELAPHVPAYYAVQGLQCDCWFELYDIRRIVTDDTRAVLDELRKLRNTHYNDRPVSIYGGMVDLPLVVTRDDGARYFDADRRERLTGGKFWVEFDAERTGIGRMEQELRENLFGDTVWSALDPAARSFIATGETIFRAHRDDLAFDFGAMAMEFAKAFEVQVNVLLHAALRGVAPQERLVNVEGRTCDALEQDWTLGQLMHLIGGEAAMNRRLKTRFAKPGSEWFTASLPALLNELKDRRNEVAHQAAMGRDAARALRDRLVGVGCMGQIVELGRVRVV